MYRMYRLINVRPEFVYTGRGKRAFMDRRAPELEVGSYLCKITHDTKPGKFKGVVFLMPIARFCALLTAQEESGRIVGEWDLSSNLVFDFSERDIKYGRALTLRQLNYQDIPRGVPDTTYWRCARNATRNGPPLEIRFVVQFQLLETGQVLTYYESLTRLQPHHSWKHTYHEIVGLDVPITANYYSSHDPPPPYKELKTFIGLSTRAYEARKARLKAAEERGWLSGWIEADDTLGDLRPRWVIFLEQQGL